MFVVKNRNLPLYIGIPFVYLAIVGAINYIPWIQKPLHSYSVQGTEIALGNQKISSAVESKIETIARTIGVNQKIEIRKMNIPALQTYGYYNAMAYFPTYCFMFPVNIPFLFVSEEFLEDLSEEEQLFLIGHELVHIREQHPLWVIIFSTFTKLLLLVIWWRYVTTFLRWLCQRLVSELYKVPAYRSSLFITLLVLIGSHRLAEIYCIKRNECSADYDSIRLLHAQNGGIKIVERWKKDFNMPEHYPYYGLLHDHPSCSERKEVFTAASHIHQIKDNNHEIL